jgi:hypothetical protein
VRRIAALSQAGRCSEAKKAAKGLGKLDADPAARDAAAGALGACK